MPRFNQHVREGDEILLGLEGDPMFPSGFKENRPKGVVTRVKSTDTNGENTSIRVKMDGGQTVDIAPHSIDPQRVWEFTDESFSNVLKRSIAEQESNQSLDESATDEPSYRGSNEVLQLRQELMEMKKNQELEVEQTRNFNNTLIATLNEMASDVCAVSSDKAGFCSVFKNEYSKMMSNEPPAEHSSAVFDSDFTDSSYESDEDF
jgi:hypothetical protein